MRRGRNEGSITRRGDGRWEGRVDYGWVDGRRVRRSVYGKTRKEAHDALQAAVRERDQGQAPMPARLTVGTFLTDDFLPAANVKVRPSTFASYKTIVDLHLVPTLGSVRLKALTAGDVERLMRSKRAEGLSARRVNMIRAVLRVALARARKHKFVYENVAADADPAQGSARQINALAGDNLMAFIEAVRGHRLEAMFIVAVSSGMRSGELLGLTWADVSLDDATITVAKALQRIDGVPQRVEPKSTSGRRTIAVPPMTVAALRAHRTRQKEERLAAGPAWQPVIEDLVFTATNGMPLDQANLLRTLRAILERAGLPHHRVHDLRHSAATAWLEEGVSARVVMEMLGHSQISLTLQTYSHVTAKLQREAADRMGKHLAAK